MSFCGWLRLLLKSFFPVVFLLSSAFAQNPVKNEAQKNGNKGWEYPRPARIHLMLAYGSELRPEKDVDANFQEHILTNFAVGYGFDQYVFILESAQFQEASGNATLRVERTLQDYMLWGQYRAIAWNRLVPFLGLGAGVYQETVVTNLLGLSTTDKTPNKFLSGVSFGFGTELPVVWFSLEARVLFGDELDRNPTLGGLARIGLHF